MLAMMLPRQRCRLCHTPYAMMLRYHAIARYATRADIAAAAAAAMMLLP